MTENEKLCLKCQLCCKILHFCIAPDVLNIAFFAARGLKVIPISGVGIFVEVPHVCKNLTAFGCADYENRPVACRVFDGTNELIKDRCLWTNKEIA